MKQKLWIKKLNDKRTITEGKRLKSLLVIAISLVIFLGGCSLETYPEPNKDSQSTSTNSFDGSQKELYQIMDNNQPGFSNKEKHSRDAFEKYSKLDSLGRCQVAFANICKELMPTEERESIGMVRPSGWQTVKYNFVDGKYLYNRCHLIAFQLAGENANERNLITGTRNFNVQGMLPFENQVADYVREKGGHVLYRVTPRYQGNNLVADGVEMEAYSVEDQGKGVRFHVFVYNAEPGVEIDYATGKSRRAKATGSHGEMAQSAGDTSAHNQEGNSVTYIVNVNTKKFHKTSCNGAKRTKPENKRIVKEPRETLISQGYEACKSCNP